MASSSVPSPLTGLPRLLVLEGLLPEAQARECLEQARAEQKSFLQTLAQRRVMPEAELAWFIARKFGCSYLDLDLYDDGLVPEKIDLKWVVAKGIIPIRQQGSTVYVALADASDMDPILTEAKFKMGAASAVAIIVEESKLVAFVQKVIAARDVSLSNSTLGSPVDETMEDLLSLVEDDSDEAASSSETQDVDDQPIVRFLRKVLFEAINGGASDIHFEPYEKSYRIRFRQDGVLYETYSPPMAIKEKLASRIKVISKLNIAERRVPQDGRLKLKISNTRTIDFRVSTCPTLFGEKIVMRILDPASAKVGIDALGYEPEQRDALLGAVSRPYGMVLVTGPTGSGKTVSLYTCLNILNQPGVNISTAEDPVEINLPGINQVQINDAQGMTFAVALKAFLRQDPDIIMVGEIRDLETADIAIKAAQTGHMVLSTLHTNDAPTTLTRMMNMGVAPFNITSSVILITAQRLGRRLCPKCKEPEILPKEVLQRAGFTDEDISTYGTGWKTYKAVGCEACKDKGYKGRVGIYQVMPMSEAIQEIILKNGTALDIARQASRERVDTLRQSGLRKVRNGLTSLEEVEAVTNA